MTVLLDDPALRIWLDSHHGWLHVERGPEQDLETLRWSGELLQNLLTEHRCTKLLNDNRRVRTIWVEAAEWMGREWFGAMAEAGLDYCAWLLSPYLYSRRSAEAMLTHVTRPTVATFDDATAGYQWLATMRTTKK